MDRGGQQRLGGLGGWGFQPLRCSSIGSRNAVGEAAAAVPVSVVGGESKVSSPPRGVAHPTPTNGKGLAARARSRRLERKVSSTAGVAVCPMESGGWGQPQGSRRGGRPGPRGRHRGGRTGTQTWCASRAPCPAQPKRLGYRSGFWPGVSWLECARLGCDPQRWTCRGPAAVSRMSDVASAADETDGRRGRSLPGPGFAEGPCLGIC